MRRLVGLICLLGLASPAHSVEPMEPDPELSKERVVFHTIAGDIVFVLFPKLAPKTVKQFLTLVRTGVYDGTHFYRVEPNFVIQLSVAQDRTFPLTPGQRGLIEKLPAEFSKEVKHHIFSLSMARETNDVNSGETSFSILLNDAPHLDGQYTIFGRVEQGIEALFEMLKVTRDSSHRPAVRLTVTRAEVVDSLMQLAAMKLEGPVVIRDPANTEETRLVDIRRVVALGLVFLMVLSLLGFFLRERLSPRHISSLLLMQLLAAAFVSMPLLVPLGQTRSWLSPIVFLGLVGMFRLLSRFES